MNKFICRLTGGHRYRASNLEIEDPNPKSDSLFIVNVCEKCGSEIRLEFSKDALSSEDVL